jgi:hypothetical protein
LLAADGTGQHTWKIRHLTVAAAVIVAFDLYGEIAHRPES